DRLAALRALLTQAREAFAKILRPVVGSVACTPPGWVGTLGARSSALRARAAADPRAFWRNVGIALGVLAVFIVGYEAWRRRPPPVPTGYDLPRPGPTDLAIGHPQPDPLRVAFHASVAPLATVGKVVTTGIELSPALSGAWKWSSDNQLTFTPAEDWPV